jgi:pimeloyl-ACP methyl ester carboxylesterase
MTSPPRVEYDEFGLFHENAAEFGLPFDEAPTVRREFVEVEPGRRLSALVWGDGAPEIVFLHGGAQNAHTWDTVALALRPAGLVAIDLPGHGHSEGHHVSARAAARDVAAVIRELAPEARGVVGMSLGGMVAIALADQAPELVAKLLLVDILPGLEPERARHITDFVSGPSTFTSFDDLLARTIEFNPTRSESSLRRGILHNALQLDDGSWVWRHRREHAPFIDVPDEGEGHTGDDDLIEALSRIEVPVLLARGMRANSVLRDDDEARLEGLLPAAQVVRFAEAGHSIQGDMPVELAATVRDFIVI